MVKAQRGYKTLRQIFRRDFRKTTVAKTRQTALIKAEPDIARAVFGKSGKRFFRRQTVAVGKNVKFLVLRIPANENVIPRDIVVRANPKIAARIFEHSIKQIAL